MIIADIELPAVLGYDFMTKNKCNIDVTSQTISLNDQIVSCQLESQLPSLFRITIDQKVTIPARSEMVLKASPLNSIPKGTNLVIDSTTESLQNRGILVAKALCKVQPEGLPLRVVNVSDKPQTIYKHTIAATAESIPDTNILTHPSDKPTNEAPQFEEIFERCKGHLTPDQYQAVQTLLTKNEKVFSKSKYDIGLTHVVQHKIDTGNTRPIKQPPRRLPFSQRKEVDTEVQKMLDHNIIKPSHSAWSSPLVVVRKADSSLRLCVDFRKINEITEKDSYPLPRIDDSLDALKGNTWFSTLDLVSGYYQCAMDPIDAPKTAFVTSKGLFEFNRMPFGLCNAGATFERLMEYVLSGLQWEICIVYLDDIIVFSETFEEQVSRLQSVFNRLYDAGLKIAP